MPTSDLALEDPKRVLTTGSFRVLQCNPRQKPFVAFGNVPIADSHDLETGHSWPWSEMPKQSHKLRFRFP